MMLSKRGPTASASAAATTTTTGRHRLLVCILLALSSPRISDAFSLRPPSSVVAPAAARGIIDGRKGRVSSSPSSSNNARCHRRSSTRPLFSSNSNNNNNNIIPYYDELMERLPSKKVLDAVNDNRGGPIVASDLATDAGISLSQARKDLSALASLTRGDIAVSSDGELLYTFPDNVSAVLSSNSAKYRALTTWKEKVFPPLFYASKVGFGVVLLVSLVAIFSTIFFATQGGGNRDDDRRDDRRGGGGGMGGGMFGWGGFWGPSPFDFFYYRPYYSRYYTTPGDPGYGERRRDPDEMGFLESVFSYVFGDGDPNGDVEGRRVALVAEMIRQNGGAVTAEQLAPFCDGAPMPAEEMEGKLGEERAYVDEGFVLPIVTQLDGEPRVTEEGDIVYVFPELMTSASSSSSKSVVNPAKSAEEAKRARRESRVLRRAGLDDDAPTSTIKTLLEMNGIRTRGALERADLVDILEDVLPDEGGDDSDDANVEDDPTLLLEREYKFSLASGGQTILAGLLGVVNLGGALYLGNILAQYASYGVRLPGYFGLIQQFFPLLLGYAVLFNAVPLARNFWIKGRNAKIEERNRARRSWKERLERRAGGVGRKLAAAARFGKRMKQLGAAGGKDIVFDTSKEFVEVDRAKEEDAMADFDKMLEKKENSAWE